MSTVDLARLVWRKSSRSTASGSNGNCVEIALVADRTAVRDSKNPATGHLTFPGSAFTTFLRSA